MCKCMYVCMYACVSSQTQHGGGISDVCAVNGGGGGDDDDATKVTSDDSRKRLKRASDGEWDASTN